MDEQNGELRINERFDCLKVPRIRTCIFIPNVLQQNRTKCFISIIGAAKTPRFGQRVGVFESVGCLKKANGAVGIV